ncbi:MAG: Rho termination factor N-terminal domain-containing protein, partial [Tepidiformaceae bacterium]
MSAEPSNNGAVEQAPDAQMEGPEMTTQEAQVEADGARGEERPRERRWEDRRPQGREGGRERRWENNRREGRGGGDRQNQNQTQTRERDRVRDRDEEREEREERDDNDRRPLGRPLNIAELEQKSREDLIALADELGVEGASTLRKQDLIF